MSELGPRLALELAIVASWPIAYLIFRGQTIDQALTISDHSATSHRRLAWFAGIMIANAIAFGTVAIIWIQPHFHLSPLFIYIVLIATVAQAFAGLVPKWNGRLGIIHNGIAYTMSATMPIITLIVAQSSQINAAVRVMALLASVYMLWTICAFIALPRLRTHYLWFQSIYILSFQLVFLALIIST